MTEKEFIQQLFLLRCDIEDCAMLSNHAATQRDRWASRLGDLLNRRNAARDPMLPCVNCGHDDPHDALTGGGDGVDAVHDGCTHPGCTCGWYTAIPRASYLATDNGPGVLMVGTNERDEVVINLPRDMTGHMVFSPAQARGLAETLLRKADTVDPSRDVTGVSETPLVKARLKKLVDLTGAAEWEHWYPALVDLLTAATYQAERRADTAENAIRAHRDARGDDRCWRDDETLYKVLPEGFTPTPVDTAVELHRCEQFIASRQHPFTVYVSPQRRIDELEAKLVQYQSLVERLARLAETP